MLTHEVSVSLRDGSICPSCGDSPVRAQEEDETLRYWCPGCGEVHSSKVNRWRQKYDAHVPVSESRDTYTSIEKMDTEGGVWVEYAVDVDTGNREDADKVYAAIKEHAGDVVQMYSSGNKGYHIQIPFHKWRYANPQWPSVFKALAELLDITDIADTAIYMPRAMLRVPGSYHSITGRRKELILDCGADSSIKESWLALIKQAEDNAINHTHLPGSGESTTFEFLRQFTPPCIQNLWLNGLPHEGSRHQAYLHLISFYYRRGDAQEETEELLQAFAEEFENNTNTSQALRVREAERLTRSAYRSGLGFDCERGQSLSVCEDTCPLFNR